MAFDGVPLALTMGDPAGCGPAITRSAWAELCGTDATPFFVIGPPDLYANSGPVTIIDAPTDSINAFKNALPVLPVSASTGTVKPGYANTEAAPAILESIETAATLALNNQVGAVITNPISKAVLYEAGFKHPGHTEFIADLCARSLGRAVKPVMMLVGGGLKVALATIHVPYTEVPGALTCTGLVEIGRITAKALQDSFAIPAPRLAFTGLNPHAGESGSIGREEIEIINPAATELRHMGISISDARPGDTVFHEALSGHFDAVIAMTHDQGLIPVKTLDIWGGVNTTLGLPIIRTSPDHGTAYDAAAEGSARPDSLISALRLASQMAENTQVAHV